MMKNKVSLLLVVTAVFVLVFAFLILHSAPAQAATIQLPSTGQSTSYDAGDDGALQRGVAWPSPRFTDNNNGTVTDNLTGLIWLKNANCFGIITWVDALTSANTLASGACGLSDGSTAGQWRLPNVTELESLIDVRQVTPALSAGHPFNSVQSGNYWSSSTQSRNSCTWYVSMDDGLVFCYYQVNYAFVWPVRGGQ